MIDNLCRFVRVAIGFMDVEGMFLFKIILMEMRLSFGWDCIICISLRVGGIVWKMCRVVRWGMSWVMDSCVFFSAIRSHVMVLSE